MVEMGEPAWRGRQLSEAIYRQRVTKMGAITTLPKSLRERLISAGWEVGLPTIAQVLSRLMAPRGTWCREAAGREKRLRPFGCLRAMAARPAMVA